MILNKKLVLSIAALFVGSSINASTQWEIQGAPYTVDTLYHAQVGPGTTQTSLQLNGATKQKLFYLTIDLQNPYVGIKTIVAQDIVTGVDNTVQEMGESHSFPGSQCFAGVNGDFYASKIPIGTNVVFGEIYNTPVTDVWHQFGITDNKVPYVGSSTITGTIKTSASSVVLNSVNMQRSDCNLTLYTHRFNSSHTSIGGNTSEILLKSINNTPIKLGATVQAQVVGTFSTGSAISIPEGHFVLSAFGDKKSFVEGLKDGEVVNITTEVNFNGVTIPNMEQMIGGQPVILSNYEVLNTDDAIDHLPAANPRTAIGYNEDKTKLVMMLVDGRSAIAAGCSSKQLADMMKAVGCADALNLDGGGSSTMFISELGVRNVPSDGKQRLVSNSIFAYHNAPEDTKVASIQFIDWACTLPQNALYTPLFYGFNKYGVLVNTDMKDVVISCDNPNVKITDGKSFSSAVEGCYSLVATLGESSVTIPINVVVAEDVTMRLSQVTLDGYKSYVGELVSNLNGKSFVLNPQDVKWSSENDQIASVDYNGEIKGISNGSTIVHGTINGKTFDLIVNVEIPTAGVMPIENTFDPTTWKFSQVAASNLVVSPFENGLSISFTGASGRGPNLKMTKKIQLWSLPDAFQIRINPTEVPISKISISTASAILGNVVTNIDFTPSTTEATYKIDMSELFDKSDLGNYPISINYIQFYMNTPEVGKSYTLELPGIEAVYNDVDKGSVGGIIANNNTISVYPNPVKSGDIVRIICNNNSSATTSVKVYDMSGALVKDELLISENGVSTLSTSGLMKGIYIIKINSQTKKLIIL